MAGKPAAILSWSWAENEAGGPCQTPRWISNGLDKVKLWESPRQSRGPTSGYKSYFDPTLNRLVAGNWPWDIPRGTADAMLRYGFQRDMLYCPSFWRQNDTNLWEFTSTFRVIGYAFATKDAPRVAASNIVTKERHH